MAPRRLLASNNQPEETPDEVHHRRRRRILRCRRQHPSRELRPFGHAEPAAHDLGLTAFDRIQNLIHSIHRLGQFRLARAEFIFFFTIRICLCGKGLLRIGLGAGQFGALLLQSFCNSNNLRLVCRLPLRQSRLGGGDISLPDRGGCRRGLLLLALGIQSLNLFGHMPGLLLISLVFLGRPPGLTRTIAKETGGLADCLVIVVLRLPHRGIIGLNRTAGATGVTADREMAIILSLPDFHPAGILGVDRGAVRFPRRHRFCMARIVLLLGHLVLRGGRGCFGLLGRTSSSGFGSGTMASDPLASRCVAGARFPA